MIQSVSGIADQCGVWAGSPGPRSAQVSRPDAKVGEEARGASVSGGVSSSGASELTPEELRVVRQAAAPVRPNGTSPPGGRVAEVRELQRGYPGFRIPWANPRGARMSTSHPSVLMG